MSQQVVAPKRTAGVELGTAARLAGVGVVAAVVAQLATSQCLAYKRIADAKDTNTQQ